VALHIQGSCHYHPMRAGIGICVECRQVVCAECSTQFEGINRCAACLARMGRRQARRQAGRDLSVGNVLTFLLVFGALLLVIGGLATLMAS